MSEKTYTNAFNQIKSIPTFTYVFDKGLNSGDGGWRPIESTDFGYLKAPNSEVAHAVAIVPAATSTLFSSIYTIAQETGFIKIQVEGEIRFVLNTGTPSGTLGFKAKDGETLQLSKAEAQSLRVYSTSGATLQVIAYL